MVEEAVYEVRIKFRRQDGPKQSTGSILEAIQNQIEGADPDELDVGESTYEITNWEVTDKTFDGKP